MWKSSEFWKFCFQTGYKCLTCGSNPLQISGSASRFTSEWSESCCDCCETCVALNVKQYDTTALWVRREKTDTETRPRCVTFQRSEVRAPLFPIQPMLWVLFQKVLSLANGPWSHEHRDRVQRRGEAARSRQPRNRKRKKKKKKKGELGSETQTPPPRQAAEVSMCVCVWGGGHSLAPQRHHMTTSWETEQLELHHETLQDVCSEPGHVRAEQTG